MKDQNLKSSLLLLLAAGIWGSAFVAQRVGSMYLGAFTFNGVRFALGSISLIPLILVNQKFIKEHIASSSFPKGTMAAGVITGIVLFLAASLQQIGLAETTAGKAAFITGLYIVLVPIFGILLKHHIQLNTWLGASVAVIGLYILSVNENFTMARGDLLELIGAVLWAVHILMIDHFTKKADALKLSLTQFVTCSVLSLAAALLFEEITLNGLYQGIVPILYGGILSVGVAYTLQVIGQKHAKPSYAAIVLSMEAVFASLFGFIILKENLGFRGYMGSALMLAGMLLSQLQLPQKGQKAVEKAE